MNHLVGFLLFALMLVGAIYIIDKVTRAILGIKKDSKSSIHVNKTHANLHTLLMITLSTLYLVNHSYNVISNKSAVIIFILAIFTFHSLMQLIFLRGSKEYIISMLTGIILSTLVGITSFFIA
ncbi:DUF4181 domain-containing protein [Piscibacillus sp. B03]|uniref:DUF4181 domain-containing protein n=1 Tax=Piscibacillus sp. B03 TaxID=3457430 RepID=UPI003FCDC99F